mmetsp:Transcript_10528/g.13348  ORF Transcript_10528/g.13348 Transcript_10528/m.13348 type:complete len:157 (+) Transcript_10528:78-548(+)
MMRKPTAKGPHLLHILGYLLLGMLLGWFLHPTRSDTNDKPTIHTSEKAWTLVVKAQFQSESDLQRILKEWKKVADYCAKHETFLLHYEVGISDKDPLDLHILERYRSKEEYLSLHKNGEDFLQFRLILKRLQDEGKVTIDGFSFQELGLGFTGRTI